MYSKLKEKHPQASYARMILETYQQKFGQIWIIQSRDMIFQWFHKFSVCRPLRWHSSNIMSQQLSIDKPFLLIFTFHENASSLSLFILRYVRAEMNVHAFMNELDQKAPLISKKIWKFWKSMYKVNGELSSCDIKCSGRVPSREGDIHNFA